MASVQNGFPSLCPSAPLPLCPLTPKLPFAFNLTMLYFSDKRIQP